MKKDTPKKQKDETIYVFHKAASAGQQERYEKKESALTRAEKNLLLGNLIQVWNSNPEENKSRFIYELIYGTLRKRNSKIGAKVVNGWIKDLQLKQPKT